MCRISADQDFRADCGCHQALGKARRAQKRGFFLDSYGIRNDDSGTLLKGKEILIGKMHQKAKVAARQHDTAHPVHHR
jgi:hypothetical protein